MTEHYTSNTESVTAYCNTCNRPTQHKVSGNRRGRCMEHESQHESARQLRERRRITEEKQNPRLF